MTCKTSSDFLGGFRRTSSVSIGNIFFVNVYWPSSKVEIKETVTQKGNNIMHTCSY